MFTIIERLNLHGSVYSKFCQGVLCKECEEGSIVFLISIHFPFLEFLPFSVAIRQWKASGFLYSGVLRYYQQKFIGRRQLLPTLTFYKDPILVKFCIRKAGNKKNL